MAHRCFLCPRKSNTFVSKKAVVDHLKDGHKIANPAFLKSMILKSMNMENEENLKIIDTSCHWRCLKFACEDCQFTTHLKSVMIKHRRRSGHAGSSLKTLQMVVLLQNSGVKNGTLNRQPVDSALVSNSSKSPSNENPLNNDTPMKNSPTMGASVKKIPIMSPSLIKQLIDSSPFKNQPIEGVPFQDLPQLPASFSFRPGNLVNARMKGYPSWPGLIFHEASSGKFYDSTKNMYYVKFFDAKTTTKGWVHFTQVTPFDPESIMEQPITPSCKLMNPGLKYRLKKAIEWGNYASGEDWTDEERLDYFQDKKK